ncbi:DUF4173 domain-containing protein [Metabacillus fastidiosus]|uniref:DUF4153 domain-containing protein n=1 Tax=Metabacillus fastidiosus TaxID=1458 RepID=UPI003D28E5FB
MNQMLKNIILCLIGGILFHYLFYGKWIGISYPLFIIYVYIVIFTGTRASQNGRSIFNYILLICIFMLSATFVLYTNEVLLVLNFLLIPVLFIIHTVHLKRWEFKDWHNRLFITAVMITLSDAIVRFFHHFSFGSKWMKGKMNEKNYNIFKKIMIGLLISIPLLWTVLYLLMSSDDKFKQLLIDIPSLFANLNIGSFIFQFLIIFIVFSSLLAYITILNKKLQLQVKEEKEEKIGLDSIIMGTILILINVIYCIYVSVQFQYFFSGDPSIASAKYTYAEYARKGFSELTVITIINLGILMIATHFLKPLKSFANILLNVLQTLLVLFTNIMLISAYMRLSLYEAAYGFTYSRIFAHSFMILLFLLLLLVLIKIWIKKIKYIQLSLIITLLAYVGLNYLNIDKIIIEKNLERYEATKKIDYYYISTLSEEAVPYLIEFNKEDIDRGLLERKAYLKETSAHWQSFNISQQRAKELLEKWGR